MDFEEINRITEQEVNRPHPEYVPDPTRKFTPVIQYRELSWAEQHPFPAALLCMLGALTLGTVIAWLLVLEGVV